jgi:hypothetical protein
MAEVLSGILRYFPNTMTMTLIVAGIMLAKISWLLVALGGIVVAIAVQSEFPQIFIEEKTKSPRRTILGRTPVVSSITTHSKLTSTTATKSCCR